MIFTGTPVRSDFHKYTKDEARLKLGIDGRPLVVSYWGSLGAERMNDIVIDFIPRNIESRLFNHIHATGGSDAVTRAFIRRLQQKMSGLNIPPWVDIRTYIDNMPAVMTAADLILCRAGASTLAELTALGRPAVMIRRPTSQTTTRKRMPQQWPKRAALSSCTRMTVRASRFTRPSRRSFQTGSGSRICRKHEARRSPGCGRRHRRLLISMI